MLRRRCATGLALAGLLAISLPSGNAQGDSRSADARSASAAGATQKISLPGVKNFGQVTPQLYRGAQPTAEGYGELQKMGVEIIVDLREERDEIERERRAVDGEHIRLVSIPWNAWKDPSRSQVNEFFEVFRANPNKKVFVHCRKGADRTGTMVALYRIAAERWTAEDAVREMKEYHLHAFWFPHLERYVRDFPRQLEADKSLRDAVTVPQPALP